MNSNLTDEQLRGLAKKRVAMKTGFMVHLLVFCLVNGGLFLLNQLVGGGRWHQFPLLGWGLGLTIHGIVTFVSLQGLGFREQMIEREVEVLRRRLQS